LTKGTEMDQVNPLERRHDNDRRTSMQAAQFPIITRNGVCVRSDRRNAPERRVAMIQVGEANVREEVFDILFSKAAAKY